MGKVDKKTLSWLTTVPAGDINFKMRLKDANIETCREALKNNKLSKLARKNIESRIKHLDKQK